VAAPRPRRISDFKPTFTNLAQTSHYQVVFGGLSLPLRQHLNVRGVGYRFIGETVGLLCNTASIPGSSFATADIVGNYMGVSETMAHTRSYTEIQLEFYVDSEYRTIKFLEHWMEFIASGSGERQSDEGYYFRMAYPEEYKTNQTKIIKFDRDYANNIEYTFYGMFPKSLNSTQVNYGTSEILKASATFNVDRYVAGRHDSYSIFRGNSDNKTGLPDDISFYGDVQNYINLDPSVAAKTFGTDMSKFNDIGYGSNPVFDVANANQPFAQ